MPEKSSPALAGFTNVTTKERIDYGKVKEYATFISTALTRKLGLAAGDAVALFSPNTVWYPIAMFATNRFGMTWASRDVYQSETCLQI